MWGGVMQVEEYTSFLVRLWRDHPGCDGPASWHGEIEHVQTGARWSFSTLEALLSFLQQSMAAPHLVERAVSDESVS